MLGQRLVKSWNSALEDFARFEAFALLVLTGDKCRRSLRTADTCANGLAVFDFWRSGMPELVRAVPSKHRAASCSLIGGASACPLRQ
jgi:hypothetical protein